jgi:hypothetical protein
MECSTSSVPLEVSSGGVNPASTSAEFSSTNNGSSVVDSVLLFRQQFTNKHTSLVDFYCSFTTAKKVNKDHAEEQNCCLIFFFF